MKRILPITLFLLVCLTSCGVHLQKRLYRNGFYISNSNHGAAGGTTIASPVNESESVPEMSYDDTAVKSDQPEANSADQPDSCMRAVSSVAQSDETTSVVPGHDSASTTSSPPEETRKTTEQEIETIRKLDLASKITLLSCFTIVLAIIAVPAVLVLSIIILNKIKKLKRDHVLTEEQQNQIEKIRSHQAVALGVSIFVLALTAIVIGGFALLSEMMTGWP